MQTLLLLCAGPGKAALPLRACAFQTVALTLLLYFAGTVPCSGPAAAPAHGNAFSICATTLTVPCWSSVVQLGAPWPHSCWPTHSSHAWGIAVHCLLPFKCRDSSIVMPFAGSALLGPGSAASCAPGYRGEQALPLCAVPGPQEGSLQARRLLQGEQPSNPAACLGEACLHIVGWLATPKRVSRCSRVPAWLQQPTT